MHGLGELELFLQAALHERPCFRKSTIDRLIHGGKWESKKQFTAVVMHGDAKLSALRFVMSHHFSRDTIAMRHGRAVVQQFGTGSILDPAGTVAQIKEIARHAPSSVFHAASSPLRCADTLRSLCPVSCFIRRATAVTIVWAGAGFEMNLQFGHSL